jgi:hypothetical protein
MARHGVGGGQPMSALPDINALFVRDTAAVLRLFGEPDCYVVRDDAFAAAYRAGRNVPRMDSDDSEFNDSTAVLFTRDARDAGGDVFRLIICGVDGDAAGRVESELMELVMDSDKNFVEIHQDPATVRDVAGEVRP